MVCPACESQDSRRSRRRSPWDYVLSLGGMAPFLCKRCARRFHARSVTLRYVRYARCGICGNLGLQKISPEHVQSPMAILGRMLGIPALRCDPCRHKFFAIRPVIQESVLASPTSRDQAA